MANWRARRWILLIAVALLLDAASFVFAGVVFVYENCDSSAQWACRDGIRDLARVLLYGVTPLTTLVLIIAASWAMSDRARRHAR